jgi:hypothetical protein
MINRNNYEEYLLMYLDGELSSEDMKSVESFLESNPDLKEEFLLLQQTILQPEDVVFTGKKDLYRIEAGISLSNYKEYFLLYIDNELSTPEKEDVETFVLQNPQLQGEFTLLKETVLPQEKIIFTHKESLYRKEEKKRPIVIGLRWASLAAAAIIGLIALVVFNNDSEIDPIAVKDPKKEQKIVPQQQLPLPVIENTTSIANKVEEDNKSNKNVVRPLKVQEQKLTQEQPVIAYEQKTQQEQRTLAIVEPVIVNNSGNTQPVNSITEPGETKVVNTTFVGSEETNYTQQALYTEDVNAEKENNLYIGALQVNTDKVRGLFRKASRFLSNKVKNTEGSSDEKVQIANIEMKKI